MLSSGYFSMHDDQQVVRLQQLDKSLKAGQFHVRWVSDLGFGYGYPLFNFYPPLSYYLGEVFHLTGLGYIDSIKMVWFTALVGSGLTMYFLAKQFWGKIGGVVAGLFYMYAPYHALDAYVRGALAELFSFVWLPLILLYSYKKKPVLTGIFLGLLMITHNLIFLPFMGVFLLWHVVLYLTDSRRNLLSSFFSFIFSVVIAFGLTAFFWLPALAEKQFTLVDQLLIKNLASYKIHFLCPAQLWYGPWGFGGSAAGCFDGVSFALGKIYWLTILTALVFAAVKRMKFVLLIGILLVFSLFMTTDISRSLWDKLSPLWYLQFPWRFLEFSVLIAALLAGFVGRKIWLAVPMVALLIFIQGKYFIPQLYIPTTDSQLLTDKYIKWDISASSFEFMPKGVATYINDRGVVWVDINQSQTQNSKLKISAQGGPASGWQNGDATVNYWQSDRFSVTGTFDENAVFQPQITNFPGWKVWVDGQEIEIQDNNKYKLITVDVGQGEHTIVGMFTNTPVRAIGNLISLAAILGIGIYGLRRSKT